MDVKQVQLVSAEQKMLLADTLRSFAALKKIDLNTLERPKFKLEIDFAKPVLLLDLDETLVHATAAN